MTEKKKINIIRVLPVMYFDTSVSRKYKYISITFGNIARALLMQTSCWLDKDN